MHRYSEHLPRLGRVVLRECRRPLQEVESVGRFCPVSGAKKEDCRCLYSLAWLAIVAWEPPMVAAAVGG